MSAGRAKVLAGVVLAVAALAVARVTLMRGDAAVRGPSPGGGAGSAPAPVEIYVVSAAPVTDQLTAVGSIRSNEEVEIRSEVSGKVEKVAFREGARVARGDLLVKINDAELRAQLARAQARLAIADEEARRQQSLHADSLTSAREYSNAVNEAGIAKADADLIRAQLEKTAIRAPFGGVIGLRSVSEGSYVSPSTVIASLQDRAPVKIEFAVPERYAERIKVGDRIAFSVEGSRRTFTGTIYAAESAIDPVTRTLRLRATSPNDDGALIPGAFADIEIVFAQRDAITVPTYAVIPELKGHRVFLFRGGKAEGRSVEIGTRTEDRVEIVDGLAAGDTLITSSLLQLKPGAPVVISSAK